MNDTNLPIPTEFVCSGYVITTDQDGGYEAYGTDGLIKLLQELQSRGETNIFISTGRIMRIKT